MRAWNMASEKSKTPARRTDWAELIRQREKDEYTRRGERRALLDDRNRRLAVYDALKGVVDAIPKTCINKNAPETHQQETHTWAARVKKLGDVWSRFPGADSHNRAALPDVGIGIEAGYRILDRACQSVSVDLLAEEILKTRMVLSGGDLSSSDVNPMDYETGIWVFFRQLDRYYDGANWVPPLKGGGIYVRDPSTSARGFTHVSRDSPYIRKRRKPTNENPEPQGQALGHPCDGEHTASGAIDALRAERWVDVTLEFIDDDTIRVATKDHDKRYNFAELGFSDKRQSRPDKLWKLLQCLAVYNGEVSSSSRTAPDMAKNFVDTVSRLRIRLKQIFGIEADPFERYRTSHSYKTKFRLSDRRNDLI